MATKASGAEVKIKICILMGVSATGLGQGIDPRRVPQNARDATLKAAPAAEYRADPSCFYIAV